MCSSDLKWQMGQNIYLNNLIEAINNVAGVLNVVDIKVFNLINGNYSQNATSQIYINPATRQIDLGSDYVLFADYDSMFEIKLPQKDIKVRTKSS